MKDLIPLVRFGAMEFHPWSTSPCERGEARHPVRHRQAGREDSHRLAPQRTRPELHLPAGASCPEGYRLSRPLDWADLATLDARGFTIREPFRLPADWNLITHQSVSKALIKELVHG